MGGTTISELFSIAENTITLDQFRKLDSAYPEFSESQARLIALVHPDNLRRYGDEKVICRILVWFLGDHLKEPKFQRLTIRSDTLRPIVLDSGIKYPNHVVSLLSTSFNLPVIKFR